MKILILGAGQVGSTLAENLAQEAFDITIVDINPSRLAELRDRLDIQTVEGQASHPNVLRRAGAAVVITRLTSQNTTTCADAVRGSAKKFTRPTTKISFP